jgi:hypothetical protein
VLVEATLDATGNVADARILSGPTEFRKATLESLLNWNFTPAAEGSTRQISIAFQLPLERIGPADAESTREFLRQEYEKASRNADALNAKLKIAEAEAHKQKATDANVALEFHNAVHAHLVRLLAWLGR